jgi:HAD superfamily hydrolase (TIGR01509 family)
MPPALKKYILFDHDGVLVDTERWYFTAGKRALAELGIELDPTLHLAKMTQGTSTWDLARAQGVDEATIDRQRAKRDRYYQEYLQSEDIEIPGVEQALRGLSTRHRMAIVTTARRVDFDLIHRQRNIVPYMDFVLTREDYDQAKPDPEPYLAGLARFDARPEEALVVEDSERGLRSAVAAGIECAILHNDFTKSHDFSAATYRIDSLDELAALLQADPTP